MSRAKEKEVFIETYLGKDEVAKKKGSLLFWHLERLAKKYTRQCEVDNDEWYSQNNRLADQERISNYLENKIQNHLFMIDGILYPIGLSVNMESSYTSIVQLGENGTIRKGVYYV